MEVDLVKYGAPQLPRGYRYQVQMFEAHGDVVEVSVSILKTDPFSLFKIIRGTRLNRVKFSRLVVGERLSKENPYVVIADEAKNLYNDYFTEKKDLDETRRTEREGSSIPASVSGVDQNTLLPCRLYNYFRKKGKKS